MSQPSKSLSNSRNIISLARTMAMSLPTAATASEAPACAKQESLFAAASTPAAASSSAPAQETKKRKSPEHNEAAHAENATKKTKKNDSSVLSPIQKLKEELSAHIKDYLHKNPVSYSNNDANILINASNFVFDYCKKNSFKKSASLGLQWGNCSLSNLLQVLKEKAGNNILHGSVLFNCEPTLKQEGKEQEKKERINREVNFIADGQNVFFVDGRQYNSQTKQGEPVVENLETETQYMKDGVLFSVYPTPQTVEFRLFNSVQKPQQNATVTTAYPMEIAAAAAASSAPTQASALAASLQPVAAPSQLFAPAAAASSAARMEIDSDLPVLEDAQFVHLLEHGSAEELNYERAKYERARDYKKMLKLAEAAASKGHKPSLRFLGEWYEHGLRDVIAINIPKAIEWYQKAAAQGQISSMSTLNRLARKYPQYFPSKAPPSNTTDSNPVLASPHAYQPAPAASPVRAIVAQLAAASSSVAAASNAPLPTADVNFERILKHGNSEQQYEEFFKYAKKKEYVKARALLQTAADRGYAPAQNSLSSAYINCKWGIEKDEQQALEWTKKAAAQNHAFGQGNLGWAYENGYAGLPKNIPEALTWYKKAAAQGNRYAQAAIARLIPRSHDEVMQVQASQAEQNRIAKNLKNLGDSTFKISNATGLTIAEIEKL